MCWHLLDDPRRCHAAAGTEEVPVGAVVAADEEVAVAAVAETIIAAAAIANSMCLTNRISNNIAGRSAVRIDFGPPPARHDVWSWRLGPRLLAD